MPCDRYIRARAIAFFVLLIKANACLRKITVGGEGKEYMQMGATLFVQDSVRGVCRSDNIAPEFGGPYSIIIFFDDDSKTSSEMALII